MKQAGSTARSPRAARRKFLRTINQVISRNRRLSRRLGEAHGIPSAAELKRFMHRARALRIRNFGGRA